jgi:hypothetical protein
MRVVVQNNNGRRMTAYITSDVKLRGGGNEIGRGKAKDSQLFSLQSINTERCNERTADTRKEEKRNLPLQEQLPQYNLH